MEWSEGSERFPHNVQACAKFEVVKYGLKGLTTEKFGRCAAASP